MNKQICFQFQAEWIGVTENKKVDYSQNLITLFLLIFKFFYLLITKRVPWPFDQYFQLLHICHHAVDGCSYGDLTIE